MSSKDQHKKNHGQGKGNHNTGKGNQSSKSTGKKEDQGGGNPNKNQGNSKQNPNSCGKKEEALIKKPAKTVNQQGHQEKNTVKQQNQQTVSQKKTSIHIGVNNSQQLINATTNLFSNKSGPPGILQLAATALSHISLNIQSTTLESTSSTFCSNTTKQETGNMNRGRGSIRGNTRGNFRGNTKNNSRGNTRGNSRGSYRGTSQNHLSVPSNKLTTAPTQIRVFSGNQESNQSFANNFRPQANITNRSNFHKQNFVHRGVKHGESPNQIPGFRHVSPQNFPPSVQSIRQVNPKHFLRGNGNSPNYEHQNKQFNPSNQANFGANLFPYFPNTEEYSQANALFHPQSTRQISAQVRAPVFKSKKDKHVAESLNQCSVGTKQIRPNFIEKEDKCSKKRSRRQRQQNFRKNKKISNNNTTPLLSFQRILSNAAEKSDSVHSDEDSVSLSRCSSDESIWTTTVSDDAADQSSDESEVTSEFSATSSFKDSGITSYASDFSSNVSTNDKLISYYWDIENCPVPHQKSPTDFVKRIRETYRRDRYEFEFVAVCDVTKLHETIVEELNASEVSMTHVSFVSKNAADAKIKSMLQTFPEKSSGARDRAVVLISGDSDFANTLNNLKYKHHVLIYLICKNNARHSLIATADECCFYEDFIKGLPMRTAEKKKSYLIILKNFPEIMKTKKIKSFVNDRLKGMNYRIKVIDGKSAEIVFQNDSVREKALLLLKNRMIAGCELQISCSEIDDVLMMKTLNDVSNINEKKNLEKQIKSSVQKTSSSEVKENSSGNKGATLCVCVGAELGNAFYWNIRFEKLWETNEFDLIWDERNNYFLANFKSLSKAQKAKKILQKQQKKDPTSPKFLKLIKQDDISINLNPLTQVHEINKQKVEEHMRVIESKKELCLKKHKETTSNLKSISATNIQEATEVINQKYNELNEQKVNFLNFYSSTIDRIKKVDIASDTIDKDLELISRDYSRECNSFSSFLPIYAKKNVILKKVKKHQIVIIRAETGSGKSTQLVQYIWRDQFMNNNKGMIICTQPRKIAAIALAKHVSSQIGCSLGDIVGYQVGITSKKSSNTSIMYVTDVTMLKMLVNDGLKDVSCIIVDEAHERTVYTDLLLGMVKSYLTSRPDLRLIITSATIDTSVFLNYFCLPTECVLEVCGRTFPVEDVWLEHDVVLGWDYFRKAIDTVDNILNQEPEGDILVFLTTPFETEKAMKVLIDKLSDKLKQSIVILQLHGKLDVTEQQKVFERTPKGKRKVVFATNCAETSITIPGIKYVVDCGLVKESQYDSIRNMNVMCVNFVSQSSSQQRRGRAGRTQVGKCYHLYSKSNYEKMLTNSDPEILRCNLGNALLKLMKIGVKNPVQFDFVQSPPPEVLDSAMAQLIKLQAVQEDLSLTDLGEKMSCLSVEPRLSHLIFKGIENAVAYEAVILAALITVSRSIFFRTSDNKSEADVKKMRFCQSESDFITYFDIYKEWSSLPKQAKNKWCVLNCINARSLRTAQELVNEITHILDKEIKIKVGSKFKEESVHEILLKIIFYSFYQNLCIYSGHPKFGYLSVNTSGNLLIHPSSSLYTFGNWRPQFLVYDSILRTDKTYLINVSPVSNEVVLEGESMYGIQLNLADLETLPLHTYSIAPVGKTIILHNIIGKQGILKRNLESKLKELMGSDSVIIDANISKGEIKIFAPQSKEDMVQSLFCPLIKDAQVSLLVEEKEIILYSNLYAVVSAGAEIKDVILPGEFRDLKVVLKDETVITDVVEKLQTCGTISTVCEFKHYCKVTFESPVQAKLALQLFQNTDFFTLQKIIKNNVFDDRANQYKIFVSFLRRKCNGIAFVTIEPLSAVSEVLGLFQRRTISYQNSILQFSVSRKTQDIRITGLPLETEQHDFKEFLNSQLIGEYKISKCVVTRDAGSEVTNYDVESTKQKIFDLFVQFTSNDKLSVDIKRPSPKDTKWHAFVYFKNCHDGETAVTILKNRKVPDMTGLRMKPMLQTFLYCKLEVFSVIKVQVEKALEFFKSNSVVDKTLEITVVPKGESNVQIQITSNNISDITDARKAILNCLLGDQIQCPDDEKWEKLFSKSGLAFLKEISDGKPDCYLEINIHKKIVTVFGNESICNTIKIEVNNFLEKLEEEDFAEIYLMPDNGKPGVLKTLLKKYGYDLSNLKEICDASSFDVNTRDHTLFVRGSTAAISKCQDIIAELQRENEDVIYEEDAELCPICLVEVSDSFHRLEYCGHAYCNECLLHFFQSSDDFPLCCISCGAQIVLADFHWACKDAKLSETEVFKKSLQVFVENRGDIGYCPSPDCPMIFRITSEENIFECPSCNNSICTRCEELYHYGISCSLYQCCKEDDDYSLKAWMQEDPGNRKLCPFCSSPIEKNGGCNHITCWKCKSHICWRCLQVFLSGDLVYEHQSQCPASNLSETLIVI